MTYQQIFKKKEKKKEKLLPLHTNCNLQQLLLYLSTLEVWKGIVPILYFIYSNMIYIIYFERWRVREWFQKYKYKELDFFCLLLRLENMKEVCGEHFKHSDACSHCTSFSLTPQSSDRPGHLISSTIIQIIICAIQSLKCSSVINGNKTNPPTHQTPSCSPPPPGAWIMQRPQ